MYCQQQERQRLHRVVAPPDMAPLVGQHLGQVGPVHALRHIDARAEQPQHKGGAPLTAAVHVVLQPHRRAHPVIDAQIAGQHIRQHHHHARQPYRRQQLQRHHGPRRLYRRLRRHRLRRRRGRQRLRRCRWQNGHVRRRCPGLGQLIQRRRHGALLRLKAHRALQGEWQHQPHRHQRPQHAYRPLGRPPQHQPRRHHHQRQHARLPRQLHDPQKNITHRASPQRRRSCAAAPPLPPPTVRARLQRRSKSPAGSR